MFTYVDGLLKYKDASGQWHEADVIKGESAYQAAVRLGIFSGTETEYYNKITNDRDGALSQINTKLTEVLSAIDTKKQQALADIPDDYTALSGDVSDLKSTLYQELNLSWVDGKYIDQSGTIYDSANFTLTDNIIVAEMQSYKVTTDIQANATICVLDQNSSVLLSQEGTAGVQNYIITIPQGGRYIRSSCYISQKSNFKIVPYDLNGATTEFFNNNGSTIIRYPKSIEVIDGFLLTSSGSMIESALWETTSFIPIFPTDELKLTCYLYGNANTIIYDKDKNILAAMNGNNAADYGGTSSYLIFQKITLQNMQAARYVRFSCWKNYKRVINTFAVYQAPWKECAEEVLTPKNLKDKKILVIGDSISTDSYGNYNKWVTDLIADGLLECNNVNNSSQHATGFVARYNNQPNDFITRLEAVENKSSYDMVIVFGGINDYIQNIPLGGEEGEIDKTVYFKPAVDYFFQYLINNFTQARICVLLPLRTYNIYPNTVGNKQEVYSQYIHDVAKSYCLPVLNLTEESGFCPFIDSFKAKWTLIPSGYTSPDGVHPNAQYEKEYLAPMIWKFISGLID